MKSEDEALTGIMQVNRLLKGLKIKGKIMKLKEIMKRQRSFFDEGITRDIQYRRRALQRLRRGIESHETELFEALRQDLGKSAYEAYATELGIVYEEISYMLRHLNALAKPERVFTPLTNFPSKSVIFKEPYGLILIMSPWNYPVQLTLVPLIGALAAGNCAVVKPSNYSPAVSAVIRDILSESFSDSYVYVILGGREENQNLLEQRFDYIFFTGGKAVGRTVMKAAAKNLTPVTLELGGKSPCIVDSTADVALAARRIVWGKFLNCGQTCVAPDYLLVHKDIKEKLLEAMVRNIEALYGPDPIQSKDYGKIVNEKHYRRLASLMEGETPYYFGGYDEEKLKIGPIILDDARWDSPCMAEEIFGPVLPVIEFEELRQVKSWVEKRPRPLALYLFTGSRENEKFILKNLSFGGGCINDTIMHLANNRMPFGGTGESGMGSYHGKYSFRTFSHEKSILKKSRFIDLPMRYAPYPAKDRLLRFFMK